MSKKKRKNPAMGFLVQIVIDNGGSKTLQNVLWRMTNAEFTKWESRFNAILDRKKLDPPMTRWEEELRRVLLFATHIPSKTARVQ